MKRRRQSSPEMVYIVQACRRMWLSRPDWIGPDCVCDHSDARVEWGWGGCAHTPDGDVNRKARDAPGDGEVAKNETPGRPGLAIRQASVRTSTAYKAETKRHPDPLIQTGILPALRDFLDIHSRAHLGETSCFPPLHTPLTASASSTTASSSRDLVFLRLPQTFHNTARPARPWRQRSTMNKLTQVESERVIRVVDELLENLSLLSLFPAQEDGVQAYVEDISREFKEQVRIERKYVRSYRALMDEGPATDDPKVQSASQVEDMNSRELRASTQSICRLMREE